jgi:hypothetical protein
VLLGREEADAVAACAQPQRQREEREQVAGRADGDDDVVNGFDSASLFCVAATVRESGRLAGVANIEAQSLVWNCPRFVCRSLTWDLAGGYLFDCQANEYAIDQLQALVEELAYAG